MHNTSDDFSSRIAVIKIIKTPLGFFVLIVLVAEAFFGIFASTSTGYIQKLSLIALLVILVLLAVVVSLLAFFKPSALLGRSSSAEGNMAFYVGISGTWWQSITPDEPAAVSYLKFNYMEKSGILQIIGRAFDVHGEFAADWYSVGSSVSLFENKLSYYWEGENEDQPNIPFTGYGEFLFENTQKQLNGSGWYYDINTTDFSTTMRKKVKLRRCTPEETTIMESGEKSAIKKCVMNIKNLIN